jgi:hypothetical protein
MVALLVLFVWATYNPTRAVSTPTAVITQLLSSLLLLILIFSLEQIARGLHWIHRNIATGAVGIAGFAIYALGALFRETA